MEFNLKTAADKLMKIADRIEKEAFDVSYFVCDECSHTANLTTINEKRMKAASEKGVEQVSLITVNDKIGCPACEGTMSYVATEESSKYYVEAQDEVPEADPDIEADPTVEEDMEDDTEEKPKKEEKKEDVETKVDEIFEPVDDQEKKIQDEKEKDQDKGGDEIDLTFGDEDMKEEEPAEETPAEDAPEDLGPVEEEKPKKKPRKKQDKPDDGKASFPKEEKPKFTEMPKEANDRFWASVAKYSVD